MTRGGGQPWAGDSWVWCLKGCQAQSVFCHCSCSWSLCSVRAATSLPVTAAAPGTAQSQTYRMNQGTVVQTNDCGF